MYTDNQNAGTRAPLLDPLTMFCAMDAFGARKCSISLQYLTERLYGSRWDVICCEWGEGEGGGPKQHAKKKVRKETPRITTLGFYKNKTTKHRRKARMHCTLIRFLFQLWWAFNVKCISEKKWKLLNVEAKQMSLDCCVTFILKFTHFWAADASVSAASHHTVRFSWNVAICPTHPECKAAPDLLRVVFMCSSSVHTFKWRGRSCNNMQAFSAPTSLAVQEALC